MSVTPRVIFSRSLPSKHGLRLPTRDTTSVPRDSNKVLRSATEVHQAPPRRAVRKTAACASREPVVRRKILRRSGRRQEITRQRVRKLISGKKIYAEAKQLFGQEIGATPENRHKFLYISGRFIDTLRSFKELLLDSDMLAALESLRSQLSFSNDLPYFTSSLLLQLSKAFTLFFRVETSIRCLLQAELMARQSERFELVSRVLDELVQNYLLLNLVEEARVKAVSLLHLAVKIGDAESEIGALNRLSICYFYMGNVARSRYYMRLAEEGLSEPDRVNVLINFSNESRIFELEKTLCIHNETDLREQIIVEHEPYQTEVAPVSGSQLRIGKLRLERKESSGLLRTQFRRGRSSEQGCNSGQVYKMHKSPNRNWENYLYFLNYSRPGEAFFIPDDRARKDKARLLLADLQKLCRLLEEFLKQ